MIIFVKPQHTKAKRTKATLQWALSYKAITIVDVLHSSAHYWLQSLHVCMFTIWEVITFLGSKLWFSWFFLSHSLSILASLLWRNMDRKKRSQSPLKLKQMGWKPQMLLFQSFWGPSAIDGNQLRANSRGIPLIWLNIVKDARSATLHEEWHLLIPRFYMRDVFWFP